MSKNCTYYKGQDVCNAKATHKLFQADDLVGVACEKHARWFLKEYQNMRATPIKRKKKK